MNTVRDWLIFDPRTVVTVAGAALVFVLLWTPWDKGIREIWRTWKGK